MRKAANKTLKEKQKIGTILDKKIVKMLRRRSADEGRTISDILQDAVLKSENTKTDDYERRLTAVNRFCSNPFNIVKSELDELLSEDYYDQ